MFRYLGMSTPSENGQLDLSMKGPNHHNHHLHDDMDDESDDDKSDGMHLSLFTLPSRVHNKCPHDFINVS